MSGWMAMDLWVHRYMHVWVGMDMHGYMGAWVHVYAFNNFYSCSYRHHKLIKAMVKTGDKSAVSKIVHARGCQIC